MFKFSLIVVVVAMYTGLLSAPIVYAHGNTEPQHGGLVKIVGEYSFELKRDVDDVKVWVFYDGEPLPAQKLKLQLKIKGDNRKEIIALTADRDNRFSGSVSLYDGEKVLTMLTLEDGVSKIVGKFTF